MTKVRSELSDNDGKCELCNRTESRNEQQLAHPVLLGGGLGWGTMWLCYSCLRKKQADGTIDPAIDGYLRDLDTAKEGRVIADYHGRRS